VLISDRYQSYYTVGEEKSLVIGGCWAHCRRRFANAIKAASRDLSEEQIRQSIAYQALAQISATYKLDESWKYCSGEYRKDHRQRILKPLVDDYFHSSG
jgi:head-tail adaptor